MKIFRSIALGAAAIVSSAALAPSALMAQAAQPVQPPSVVATPVSLETKIDTKTVKAGDAIAARLMFDAAVGDKKFPTGSRLLGKIVSVDGDTLVLVFESIQVKKADPVPVHVGLAAIAPAYDAYTPSASASPMGGGSNAPTGPGPLDMPTTPSMVKNVTVTLSKTADVSGTLSSSKDFKLDKGTRMWVGIF